jgi:hypothetical protein
MVFFFCFYVVTIATGSALWGFVCATSLLRWIAGLGIGIGTRDCVVFDILAMHKRDGIWGLLSTQVKMLPL